MKRHVQTVGVREWAGDDLVELQREPLSALDAFFAEYGPCIVQGCETAARADDSGTFDVSAGLVALEAEDPDGMRRVMTMPFSGASGVALPLYLTASVETLTDVYGDGKSKPIAYAYTARAVGSDPGAGIPHLVLAAEGGNRFVDAVQDPEHRFVSDAERARWDRVLEQAKAYADSVSATGSEALKKYLPLSGGTLTNGIDIDRDLGITASFGVDTGGAYMLVLVDGKQAGILYLNANGLTYTNAEGKRSALWHSGNFDPNTVFRADGYIESSQLNDNTMAAIGNKACIVSYGGYGGLLVSFSANASPAPLQFLLSNYTKDTSLKWRHGIDANRFEDPSFRTIWDSGNFDAAASLKYLGRGELLDEWDAGHGFANSTTPIGESSSFLCFGMPGYRIEIVLGGYSAWKNGWNRIFFRSQDGDSGKVSDWKEFYHSGNLGPATASSDGLMSAADKRKLDGTPRMIWGSVAADGRKVRGGNFSSRKNGNYIEITHNLGTTEYAVVATANAESTTDRRDNYISALSKGANICSMAVISGDGKNTIEASAFDFVIYY